MIPSFRLFLFCICSCLIGCKTVPVKREIRKVEEISSVSSSNKFIKAHLKNGKVYILHNWYINASGITLNGYGTYLDVNRNVIENRSNLKQQGAAVTPAFEINFTDIALIETNDPGRSVGGALTVVTGVTGLTTMFCLINPKACFGSCPTFYAHNGDTLTLQAEGFSTSVSPSLEKKDIDMLYNARAARKFELIVTNEALETHCINHANILAFDKNEDERVFASDHDRFYKTSSILKPISAASSRGDCLAKISSVDGAEYFSLADESNLNSKEELILHFSASGKKDLGLVIGKRQTLLTTFLMYQALAYMGNSVTYWLTELERGKLEYNAGVFDLLGGIDIYSRQSDGKWKFESSITETGPIAVDFNIIPLSLRSTDVEVKLVLNKGLWRIDYLALAEIDQEVTPVVVSPSEVEIIKGSETLCLEKLKDESQYLVTYPGEGYKIKYELPFRNAEVFLDSKGYYLEWIRDEWVKEQSFAKLNFMLNKPEQYLKKAAKQFKKLEPSMEETFWNSRYVLK